MKHYEKLLEKGCFSRATKMVIYDYFVDVANIEESLTELKQKLEET